MANSPRFKPSIQPVGSPPVPTGITPGRQVVSSPFTAQGPSTVGPTSLRPAAPPTRSLAPEISTVGPQSSPGPIDVFKQISDNYSRPKSFLHAILRVLGVGENVVVAFADAFSKTTDDVPGWATIKALGLGFSEIPTAVTQNWTIDDFNRATHDPDSFWYRHANVVGLGLSVFFDPVTYLTFGATGASKVAAKSALSAEWKLTAEQAVKDYSSGYSRVLGRKINASEDIDSLMVELHAAHGRPFTLGDALDNLKASDLEGGSFYRQVFPRGGQGIRFAGIEIPGSRTLNESLGALARRQSRDLMAKRGLSDAVARGLVSEAKLKSIANDARRALSLTEFRSIEYDVRRLSEGAAKSAAAIAAIDNPVARKVAGIFGQSVDYVSQSVRKGLLRHGGLSTLPQDSAEARIVRLANLQKANVLNQAKNLGMDERQISDLHELWDKLVAQIDDPVEVVAQFRLRAESRLIARRSIRRILENPLLARRIDRSVKGAEGLLVQSALHYEPIIKESAKPFTYEGKTYAVSDTIYEALEQIKNPAFVDVELSRVFRYMNGAQNLWKIPATVLNPAFHTMNLVGGMWNNMLAAPYGPFDYLEAWTRVLNQRAAEGGTVLARRGLHPAQLAAKAGAKVNPGLRAMAQETPEQAAEFMSQFERRGSGGGQGFVTAEQGQRLARDIAKSTGDKPLSRRAFTAARRVTAGYGVAQIGLNAASSEGWIDDTELPYANELWGVVGLLPEASKLGRHASTSVEQVLRLTPFQETYKDKGLRRMAEAIGPIQIPQFAKTAPKGLTKRQQSMMFDIGAEMATHFQFDYSKLSPFERNFAKTVFPFWTFYKNNFVLQVKEIAQRPRFVNTFFDTTEAVQNYAQDHEGEISPEMQNLLPEYFDQLGAFQIPVPDWARDKFGLPQDMPLYLNPKLPFVSLNLFPPLWELFNDNSATPFWQRMEQTLAPTLGSVGPFAAVPVPGTKLLFEAITGHNLGLARPLDYQRVQSGGWRESITDAPGYAKYLPKALRDYIGIFSDPETGTLKMHPTWKYVMDALSSPFIANYGKVIPTSDTGERGAKARADLVSWMTGIRLMPVDFLKINRSWAYRVENMLEAQKADARNRGAEFSPDDDRLLHQLRQQIKVIEKAWDQRNIELFGSANG